MTDEQYQAVTDVLREQPSLSNREIARQCGVDEKTVRRLRQKVPAGKAAGTSGAAQSQEPATTTLATIIIEKEESIMANQKPATAVAATITEPQQEAPTIRRSETPSGYLPFEERQAGYALVELGPKSRGMHGDPDRHGIFVETDHRHPGVNGNNTAHVVFGRVVKVYRTPLVNKCLLDGRLQESYLPETTGLQNVSDKVDDASYDVNAALLRERTENEKLRDRLARLEEKMDAAAK